MIADLRNIADQVHAASRSRQAAIARDGDGFACAQWVAEAFRKKS